MKHSHRLIIPLSLLLIVPSLLGYTSLNSPGYPSDVISFFDKWKITMGDGSEASELVEFEHEDYFYNTNDGTDWVVYKTPNSGGTASNLSNTRSELRQLEEWIPETGAKLSATLKVMRVSTSGDARVPATFSVVVGQIQSSEGHENAPLKIFYKKYPAHTKGSVFWNYEINTDGDNGERWDYSTAVWGHDWSVVGSEETTWPAEPEEGIELGEEFSYEVNVFEGVMYLTFMSEGHPTRTFTKDLTLSDYSTYSEIPEQVLTVFGSTGQDGTEQSFAYEGELQYFKQGAYNQTNGKDPEDNMVWNTGADTYGGDLADQYAAGSYAEVWFKEAAVGEGTEPGSSGISVTEEGNIRIFPNPVNSYVNISSSAYPLVSVKVINLAGKSMMVRSALSAFEVQLDLSNFEPGLYLLQTEDVQNSKTVKLITKL